MGHTTTTQTLDYVIDYNADVDDFDSMIGLNAREPEEEERKWI